MTVEVQLWAVPSDPSRFDVRLRDTAGTSVNEYEFVADGGASASGVASVRFNAMSRGAGGALGAGAGPASFTRSTAMDGGGLGGGTANWKRSSTKLMSGGSVAGGDTVDAMDWFVVAEDGAVAGGGGDPSVLFVEPVDGGAVASGSGDPSQQNDPPELGGAEAGGRATIVVTWLVRSAGGATGSGIAHSSIVSGASPNVSGVSAVNTGVVGTKPTVRSRPGPLRLKAGRLFVTAQSEGGDLPYISMSWTLSAGGRTPVIEQAVVRKVAPGSFVAEILVPKPGSVTCVWAWHGGETVTTFIVV